MQRDEYIACIEVRNRLAKNIKGRIFATMNKKALMVYVHARGGIKYTYEYHDVHKEMVNGELNYEKIVSAITRNYKKFIFNLYLKNNDFDGRYKRCLTKKN